MAKVPMRVRTMSLSLAQKLAWNLICLYSCYSFETVWLLLAEGKKEGKKEVKHDGKKEGKKKEVKKETGLGLSYKKDENFGEWYSEVWEWKHTTWTSFLSDKLYDLLIYLFASVTFFISNVELVWSFALIIIL